MRIVTTALLAALAIGALPLSTGAAGAAPLGIARLAAPETAPVVQVRNRNVGAAIAAGAAIGIIGGIIAAQQRPYYYGPAPVYVEPAPVYVAPAPVYAAPPVEDAVAYCMRRYRSYDPYSGTFLGYDGLRHPCP